MRNGGVCAAPPISRNAPISPRRAATKEARKSELSACNAKFAGRRKPGGGYTYFDFMQNRSFDIAGPNPTADEQKHIDEQYTAFLDRERRSSIASALAVKQQQSQQAAIDDRKGGMRRPSPISRRSPRTMRGRA